MMARSQYNFENPAFVAEPVIDEVSTVQGGDSVSERPNTAPTVTEIKISDNAIAIARDNPMYESAEEVLRKHAGVVHNPVFVDDSLEEENTEDRNSRLWQRLDQLQFSKAFF